MSCEVTTCVEVKFTDDDGTKLTCNFRADQVQMIDNRMFVKLSASRHTALAKLLLEDYPVRSSKQPSLANTKAYSELRDLRNKAQYPDSDASVLFGSADNRITAIILCV